jgi:hypothetical protein
MYNAGVVAVNSKIAGLAPWLPDGMYFQTKNPNLYKYWWVLLWKMLV